jgi:hypothetical protein
LGNKLSFNGSALTVNGIISASAGNFSGNITSTATITGGSIVGGTVSGGSILGGTMNINNNFIVDATGTLTAVNANLSGTITATQGNIGGFTIGNNQLLASGSLLRIDTSIPQIEFYTNATGSAKVVLNPKRTLTDPSGEVLYISGAMYDGTDGNRTAAAGTTAATSYVTQEYYGSKGISTKYGFPYVVTAFAEAGATNMEVYIPETSLAISTTNTTATSDYPPFPPSDFNTYYQSDYAQQGSVSAQWYVQMFNSTGTTFISEVAIAGASTYRNGAATNSYYYAVQSYSGGGYGFSSYYWQQSNPYTSPAYYSGNITQGAKAAQMVIPSTGVYQFRLVLKLSASSARVVDYVGSGATYYATTGTSNHTRTGYVFDTDTYSGNFQFSPNINKTEITNGGIQVLSNKNAYVKFNRIDPSSYGQYETIGYHIGAKSVFRGFGDTATYAYYGNNAIDCSGGANISGKLTVGGGNYFLPASSTVFEVAGPSSAPKNISTFSTDVLPGYPSNFYTLGNTSYRWNQVWVGTGAAITSDATQKFEIEESKLGLDFINKLQPVSYKFISGSAIFDDENWSPTIDKLFQPATYDENGNLLREAVYEKVTNDEKKPIIGYEPGKRTHYGLLAQNVKTTLDELDIDTNGFAGYIEGNLEEHSELALRYDEFIAPMIKAIQQLSAKVEELEARISGSI